MTLPCPDGPKITIPLHVEQFYVKRQQVGTVGVRVQEVVIRKDATERTETVRDRGAAEDIEVIKGPRVEPATGTAPAESTKYNEPKI
jgi:stress response protein YsnF